MPVTAPHLLNRVTATRARNHCHSLADAPDQYCQQAKNASRHSHPGKGEPGFVADQVDIWHGLSSEPNPLGEVASDDDASYSPSIRQVLRDPAHVPQNLTAHPDVNPSSFELDHDESVFAIYGKQIKATHDTGVDLLTTTRRPVIQPKSRLE